METYLHFVVKSIVAFHVLRQLWIVLLRGRLFGVWRLSKKQDQPEDDPDRLPAEPVAEPDDGEVVGRTQSVYLKDPDADPEPVWSDELEPTGFIGRDEEISADDVEVQDLTRTAADVLPEEERFEVLDRNAPGLEAEFSTGLTFEKLANAVGVLTDATGDEDKVVEAAKTLYDVRQTDLFEFFTTQISNKEMVERLLHECLDEEGRPRPQRKAKATQAAGFNWKKFV